MPVTIKELHIKVNVESPAENRPVLRENVRPGDQEAIVAVCVEKVLEVLEQKKQR